MTTSTTDRAAFEAELRNEEEWGHRSFGRYKNGDYKSWQIAFAWSVWQAATAAERERAAQVCRDRANAHHCGKLVADSTRAGEALCCEDAIRSGV